MEFRTYRIVNWSVLIALGAYFIALSAVFALGWLPIVILLVLGWAYLLHVTIANRAEQLDDMGGVIPLPGVWGQLGDAVLERDDPDGPRVPRPGGLGPICPKCGFPPEPGEHACSKCGFEFDTTS